MLLRPKAGAEAKDEDDDKDGSEETGRDQQQEQLAGESNGDIPDDTDHAGGGDKMRMTMRTGRKRLDGTNNRNNLLVRAMEIFPMTRTMLGVVKPSKQPTTRRR